MRGEKVDFYGNAGVCIFKYLVRTDDPQWIFSSSVLLMNCLCFLFISGSYMLIGYKINLSGRHYVVKTRICPIGITRFSVFCAILLASLGVRARLRVLSNTLNDVSQL